MGGHYYDKEGNSRHNATMKEVRSENLLISVTTYLGLLDKPGLNKWKEGELLKAAHSLSQNMLSLNDLKVAAYNQFDKENFAHIVGTQTHKIVELLIKEQPDANAEKEFFFAYAEELAQPLYSAVMMAYHWHQSIATKVGTLEETVLNPEENYAGQLDYFGEIKTPNGVPAPGIIDWKTQNLKNPGFGKRDPSKLLAVKINKYDAWGLQMGAYGKIKRAEHGYIGVISSNPQFPYFKAIPYSINEIVDGYKNFIKIKDVYRYIKKM